MPLYAMLVLVQLLFCTPIYIHTVLAPRLRNNSLRICVSEVEMILMGGSMDGVIENVKLYTDKNSKEKTEKILCPILKIDV